MENSSKNGPSSLSKAYGVCKSILHTKVTANKSILSYYLLKGFVCESERDTYSVLITESDGEDVIECEFVSDISTITAEAKRMYDILCRNMVTPSSLFDVLTELL